MKGLYNVRECIELRSAFQNYTTGVSSMEIPTNNCMHSPHKLNHEKTDAGGGPETKDQLGVALHVLYILGRYAHQRRCL